MEKARQARISENKSLLLSKIHLSSILGKNKPKNKQNISWEMGKKGTFKNASTLSPKYRGEDLENQSEMNYNSNQIVFSISINSLLLLLESK